MIISIRALTTGWLSRARSMFTQRDFLVHDGRTARRIRIAARTQVAFAAAGIAMVGFSGYGVAQAAQGAAVASGIVTAPASAVTLDAMTGKVAAMQARVADIRRTAQLHADRIEHRQALLVAVLTGEGETKRMALATLTIDPAADRLAATTIAPLRRVELAQADHAEQVRAVAEARLSTARRTIRKLGLRPDRIVATIPTVAGAMGGPLIEATGSEAVTDLQTDQKFRSLFMTWKKLDNLEQGVIAIPSVQPVEKLQFTSNFGIRSDPFRGTAAMHAGVDIPGPTGTPIYATADGVISHAGRQGGYGNMIEINHGKGIATRYGHLSRIIVGANTRVTRGQMIGRMGSTGRSTGPHLHYEVRIDGHAVNPVPFLTTADYLLAARDRSVGMVPVSQTGPAPQD